MPSKSSRKPTSNKRRAADVSANAVSDSDQGGEEPDESIMGDVSEELFFDLADAFIDLANQHSEKLSVQTVSAAFMYAASRYNAFLAVNESPDSRLEAETAVEYFTLQYRKMFEDNLGDYLGTHTEDVSDTDGDDDDDDNSRLFTDNETRLDC